MSYTIPTNVQTKAEAVLALASTIADADKTNLGDGSVNKALDVLADTLAEYDVTVPNTNAGAILALADYVSGGGGGGGSVGALVDVPRVKYEPVEIGGDITGYLDQIDVSRVKLGSDIVVEGECTIMRIALGSTFEHDSPTFVGKAASAKMYDATLAPNAREEMVISSISEISGAAKLETLEVGGDEIQRLTVNIPAAAPADSHAYVLEIIPAE